MRTFMKASYVLGVFAAVALSIPAADARSLNGAYDSVSRQGTSIPYDAGGPAYTAAQRGQNDSSDFQLQGR
jgi:hypothetical protein